MLSMCMLVVNMNLALHYKICYNKPNSERTNFYDKPNIIQCPRYYQACA